MVEAKEQNWFAQNFLTNIQFPFRWAQFVIIFLLIEFDGLRGWGEECNVELTTSTAAVLQSERKASSVVDDDDDDGRLCWLWYAGYLRF